MFQQRQLKDLLAAVGDPAAAARLPANASDLLRLARHHRLSPLLSAQQGDALPARLADLFRRDRLVTAARGVLLAHVAEECVRALAQAGVPAILLKGLDYERRLYGGSPGARPTSDVDLLVPNDARRTAFGVLDRLKFEPRAAAPGFDDADYHEVAWTRDGLEVDLHLGLAPFARCRIDYDRIWRDAVPLRLGATEAQALAPPHAAIFHGLHMAIDHFAVPAIYLVDLARLLPEPGDYTQALVLASKWRCARPLVTATALTKAYLPGWPAGRPTGSWMARRVIAGYGAPEPLPRPEQLLRKVMHFDGPADAIRYLAVQSRRNAVELIKRRIGKRSPRQRLAL